MVVNVSFLGGSPFPRYNDLTASLMLALRLASSAARELVSARDAVDIVGLRPGAGEAECPANGDDDLFFFGAAVASSMIASALAFRFFVFDLTGSREGRSSIASRMRCSSSSEGLMVKTSDDCENLAAHWGQTSRSSLSADPPLLSSPFDASLDEVGPRTVRRADCENTQPQERMYTKGWAPFISFRLRGQTNWGTSLGCPSVDVTGAGLGVSFRVLTSWTKRKHR